MAIRTISTRMAIEGEAQYKQAISACNGELKTLKSSLALVESSFRGNANSMEALTEKGKVLADMHTQQEAKVQELQKALENSQNYQKKYADAAAEAGKKVEECSAALEALKSSAEYTRPEQQALTKELNNWKKAQEDAEASNYAAAKSVQEWKQQINKAKIEQNDLKEAIQNNNQYLEEAAASADGCATSIDEYGKAVEVAAASTKEAVEGEKAYKQSISNCDSELKTLKSSLALVESQYRGNANSMEALMEKGKVLFDIQAKQAEKVQTLGEALQNAQEHQKKYSDAAAEAGQKVAECKDSLEKLKQSTGDTMEEQAALTAEIKKWQQAQTEAEEATEASSQSVQEWQQQLNSAKVEQADLAEAIQKNNQHLDEAEKSADGCATSIDKYGKEVDKSKDAIDQLAAALASAGIAKGVQEIAEALMDCSAAAEGFESSIAKVATIADTSATSMDEIKAQIIDLSNETGKSASAIAEATYSAISAGVDTASAVETVAQAAKLAAGGFTETETAVDVLTTAINAYGLSATEAGKVSDILITTQNKGKTSVDELAKSVGSVIPLAAAYNVEMDNLGTAYAVLTASGTATSEAGTKINAMLSELGDSGSKVAGVLQEQTGQSFASLTKDGASLGDVLAIIGDSVGGNTTAFNELWSSTEAGVGALSIFNKGAENFNSVLGEMQNSAGATEAAYKTMADTTENAHQRMTNAAENLKIAIGDQLNPALENLYDTGADAFTWATDFVTEHPAVVKAVAAVVVGLGTLATGVAAITAATAALNAVLTVANPVTLIAAAAVAAVTAIGAFAVMTTSADEDTKAFTASLQETKAAYEELSATMEGQQASTAASLAALEELLAVEDKSAAQKQIIAEKVAELNEAVPNLGLAYDAASDSINMTTDALEHLVEKAGEQEEYEAQVARLSELYTEQKQIAAELEAAQAALNEARETGSGNVLTLQNNIDALTEAQEANAEEIAALEEASREYGERQAEAAEKTEEMTSRIESLTSEMDTLQAAYQESYDKAMESIEGQMGLFEEMDGSAKTSIDSLIETLKGQVSYMETYSENIKKAMEMGVDEGLVKKLSDGSVESAQILDAIVKGGQDDIKALNEELAKVEQGKKDFSDTVAQMETDFNEKMGILVGDLNDAIQEMDLHDDAYDVGYNNMQGLIDGTAEQKKALVDKYTEMGNAALAAYKRAVAQASPSKKFKEAGSYDIQGIIQGAESERARLEAAYTEAAQAALHSMERAMPSTFLEPRNPSPAEQTAAIAAAVRQTADNRPVIQLNIDHMEVRSDADIDNVTQKLYYMVARETRGRGGVL